MRRYFNNLSIGKKQIVVLLLVALLPMLLISVMSLNVAKNEVETQAFAQLAAVRDIKSDAIERHFNLVNSQIKEKASSSQISKAMASFKTTYPTLLASLDITGDNIQEYRSSVEAFYEDAFSVEYQSRNNGEQIAVEPLVGGLDDNAIVAQYHYISANQNALGEKHLLNRADGNSAYHQAHAEYHPNIRNFLEEFGYYDIFLIDIETGNIVYSVFKELDYGTSLLTGPYKDTNFAEAFRSAAQLSQGEIAFEDFHIYRPSYDAPASFVATPIFDNGERVGVIVFQIPLEPVNAIMGQRSGMGETGESYLVGSDFLMRSDSYLDPQAHSVVSSFKRPETGRVETDATLRAFSGETSEDVIVDYNGNNVLSAFSTLNINGTLWSVIVELDVAEAFAGVKALELAIIISVAIASVLVAAIAYFIGKMLASPVLALSESIQRVASSGRFVASQSEFGDDEVGQTARAFDGLLLKLAEALTGTNRVLGALAEGDLEQRVTEDFVGDLGTLARGVNSATAQVSEASAMQAEQAEIAAKKADEAMLQARRATIVKQALDVSATASLITDTNFNIVYANEAMTEMVSACDTVFAAHIPAFQADAFIHSSLDMFYASASTHRDRVLSLKTSAVERMQMGALTFDVTTTPIRDGSGEFLGAVVEWNNLTETLARVAEEKVIFEENSRIRQALDNSSTSTIIADHQSKVIYANDSFRAMLSHAGTDFRQHSPGFDPRSVVGHALDQICDSFKQRSDEAGTRELVVGHRTFNVTSNPILSASGERLGTVVEWLDRTVEVQIESEVDEIIHAAATGDFGRSLDTASKTGFFLQVSEGLNQLMETTGAALEDIGRVFSAMSQGDLTQKIEKQYSGEFGKLKSDANSMVDRLREIIDGITSGTRLIVDSSSEISSGTVDLSRRTESQAASLEETSASMEQMLRTVEQGVENANSTNQLAKSSIEFAKEGDESVKATVSAMQNISESSNRIVNIVSVIDEIAFQTNLLALNAAVEAARAGEQGRGFAVVASEVRKLAQRSADSAKEIKSLIGVSVQRVDEGSKLVERSGDALSKIVDGINGVAHRMDELMISSQEQSGGIQQVGKAVSDMDQITQQNAALVEEAAAASEVMSTEAQKLLELVSFFSSRSSTVVTGDFSATTHVAELGSVSTRRH